MKKDFNVQFMDDLMDGITQSETWTKEQMQNPQIKEANRVLGEALKKIRGTVSNDTYFEIEEAAYTYATAFETAAILYGIHVADAMRDVAARPSDLSRYILARSGKVNA